MTHSTIGQANTELAAVNMPKGWASTLAPSKRPAKPSERGLGRRSACQVAGSDAIHSPLESSCGHTP